MEEEQENEETDKLSIDTEEVLEAIAKLDEDGLDNARRLLNEIYMRTPRADDEESN